VVETKAEKFTHGRNYGKVFILSSQNSMVKRKEAIASVKAIANEKKPINSWM